MQHHTSRAMYGVMLDAGIEIIEYAPSFLHAKVAVFDSGQGGLATVGSSNLDPLSLLLAREANVAGLVVWGGPMSAPILTRLGFQTVGWRRFYVDTSTV